MDEIKIRRAIRQEIRKTLREDKRVDQLKPGDTVLWYSEKHEKVIPFKLKDIRQRDSHTFDLMLVVGDYTEIGTLSKNSWVQTR